MSQDSYECAPPPYSFVDNSLVSQCQKGWTCLITLELRSSPYRSPVIGNSNQEYHLTSNISLEKGSWLSESTYLKQKIIINIKLLINNEEDFVMFRLHQNCPCFYNALTEKPVSFYGHAICSLSSCPPEMIFLPQQKITMNHCSYEYSLYYLFTVWMIDFSAFISYISKSYHELKMVRITNTNHCFYSPKEIVFSMNYRKERQVSQRMGSLLIFKVFLEATA